MSIMTPNQIKEIVNKTSQWANSDEGVKALNEAYRKGVKAGKKAVNDFWKELGMDYEITS